MIAPGHFRILGASNDPALVLGEVFMAKTPGAFDVDDSHASSAAAWTRPSETGIDTGRGGVEINLTSVEISRCRGRLFRGGCHVVEEDRRERWGFYISGFHLVLFVELCREAVESRVGRVDAVKACHFLDRCTKGARCAGEHAFFACAEQGAKRHPFIVQHLGKT